MLALAFQELLTNWFASTQAAIAFVFAKLSHYDYGSVLVKFRNVLSSPEKALALFQVFFILYLGLFLYRVFALPFHLFNRLVDLVAALGNVFVEGLRYGLGSAFGFIDLLESSFHSFMGGVILGCFWCFDKMGEFIGQIGVFIPWVGNTFVRCVNWLLSGSVTFFQMCLDKLGSVDRVLVERARVAVGLSPAPPASVSVQVQTAVVVLGAPVQVADLITLSSQTQS